MIDNINLTLVTKKEEEANVDDSTYTKKDLEDLLDSLPFSVWLKDTKGKYKYINQKFIDQLKEDSKIDNNDIVDKNSLINNGVNNFWSNNNEKYLKKIDKYIAETGNTMLDEEYLDINGVSRWFESYRTRILDNEGKLKYISGIAKDVTSAKIIQDQFTRGYWMFSDIDSIFDLEGNEVKEVKEILNNVLAEMLKRVKANTADIWLFNKDAETLSPIFSSEINRIVTGEKEYIKSDYKSLRSKTLAYKKNCIIDLTDNNNIDKKEVIINSGIHYIGVYNIEIKSEIIGLLTIGYSEKNKPIYRQDVFVKAICDKIGILINTNKLRSELKNEFIMRNEAEKEREEFLDTAVDLMAIINEDGTFVKANDRWNSILGWSKDELLSINFEDIVHSKDKDDTAKYLRSIKDSTCQRGFRNRCLCKDGTYKWIEWSTKLNNDKKIYIVTGEDVTEEKNLEVQKKVYEEALYLENIKNEFFANISHEFKTPLNIILATMQLVNSHIENNKISAEVGIDLNKYMSGIKQNSYRLLRLVNNIIDMTRIDTGYYEILPENHNIVSVIEDITMSVVNYTEDNEIDLIFDTEIEELVIACDADKIERIMLNLLSNAVKHTNKTGKIEVLLKLKEDKVQISIKDNGSGIAKNKLATIFERFVQVDETLSRRNEGSGIGLSLVKSLIEMHGGSIWVESEEGKGAEFIFELPIVTIKFDATKKKKQREEIKPKIEKCKIEFSDIYC